MTGWTWDQVRDQLDLPRVGVLQEAWKDNPPPAIMLRLAAEALGVKLGSGPLLGSPGEAADGVQEANPQALMAEIGQAEPLPYVPPRRGLIIPEPPKTD